MEVPSPPNKRPTEQNAAAGRAAVARKWKRHKRKPRGDFNRAPLRIRDLKKWFSFRYGRELPDDDAGLDDIEILINYVVTSGKSPWPVFEILTPWLEDAERQRIVESTTRCPIWHTDDDLARRLGILYEQRQALRITSFSSVDVDLAGCRRLRLERDKASKSRSARADRRSKLPSRSQIASEPS